MTKYHNFFITLLTAFIFIVVLTGINKPSNATPVSGKTSLKTQLSDDRLYDFIISHELYNK